jgi:hypothetical protein
MDAPASPADVWNAIFTGITALVAVVALLAAGRQVRYARDQVAEARRVREEQAQPYVTVSLELGESWANLVHITIRNFGNTAAYDIRITFEPPLVSKTVPDIASIGMFKSGIPTLVPGQSISCLFDMTHERMAASDLPQSHDATVRFNDSRGQNMEPLMYRLDFDQYRDLEYTTVYTMHHATEQLKTIAQTINAWNDSGWLKITTRNADYRRTVFRWFREVAGRWPNINDDAYGAYERRMTTKPRPRPKPPLPTSRRLKVRRKNRR